MHPITMLGAGLAGLCALCAGASAAPPGAIPFHCVDGAGAGFESIVTCRRSDSRASFTTIPAGMFLHITDIVVNPNNAATVGTFKALLGRDDADAFATSPSVDLIGSPTQVLHFSTPYLVFREGETMSLHNYASSDFPIDLRLSGYLAPTASP